MTLYYIDNLTDKMDAAKLLISRIPTVKLLGLDTETTGLDPFTSKVLLLQLKVGDDIFILDRGKLGVEVISRILNLINENNVLCVGQNIKFDMKQLRQDTGIWLRNVYDTMVIEAVLTSGLGGKYVSLLELVKKYCGVDLDKESRLEFVELDYTSIFTERQLTYAATDVLYLEDIYNKQMEAAHAARLIDIVDLECKVEPVVARMEREGITLDIPYWNDLTELAKREAVELKSKLKNILFEALPSDSFANALQFAKAIAIPTPTKKLKAALESLTDPLAVMTWAMDTFNIGSHKQLLTALNLAGIETPSTDEKVLNKLPKNEIIDTILEYRGYEKMITTYGDNVVRAVNPVTGKIHADFNQVGTSTGRFSSSGGVNMQNIPTKNGYREGFISKPGYSFIAMDYSQCEYRLTGAVSREQVIIDAYKNNYDMHIATAANFFGKDQKDVTKDERSWGKTRNFEIIYGATEWGLSKSLKSSLDHAKDVLNRYWEGYPTLSSFKIAAETMIVKLGYSVTPMGRRRYFKPMPAIATPKEIDKYIAKMKREGFNMIIQGGTADVLKIAMISIDKKNPFGDRFALLLQVHDELVAEVEDSILKDAEDFMRTEMINAFQPFLGEIPAVADGFTSKRWTKS